MCTFHPKAIRSRQGQLRHVHDAFRSFKSPGSFWCRLRQTPPMSILNVIELVSNQTERAFLGILRSLEGKQYCKRKQNPTRTHQKHLKSVLWSQTTCCRVLVSLYSLFQKNHGPEHPRIKFWQNLSELQWYETNSLTERVLVNPLKCGGKSERMSAGGQVSLPIAKKGPPLKALWQGF